MESQSDLLKLSWRDLKYLLPGRQILHQTPLWMAGTLLLWSILLIGPCNYFSLKKCFLSNNPWALLISSFSSNFSHFQSSCINFTMDYLGGCFDALSESYRLVFRYLKVFQYLIRLKRTQMELEKSWASVMHQDHIESAQHRKDGTNRSISQQRREGIRPMWPVREHMAFLIRNLQFYIQVKKPMTSHKNFKVGHKPV